MIQVNGNLASVRFDRFDLANYDLFLRCKRLPESKVTYDWRSDSYTITTPARFAGILGVESIPARASRLMFTESLFDYQSFIVNTALDAQRYAIYADCGLGKTLMQLEWARQVVAITGGRVLILAPPQVIPQTIEEAQRFYGDSIQIEQLSSREALIAWLKQSGPAIGITNYEKFIPGQISELRNLAGIVCDESSILKTGGGTIKWNLIHSAKGIEYKLSCTATPAPNEIMEHASQAAFLEKIRNDGEVLWTFFQSDKQGNWHLRPHAEPAFYRFLAGWSIYLRNPATYGWKDNNVDCIPKPQFIEHKIESTDAQMEIARCLWHEAGAGLLGHKALGITQRSKLSQIAKGFIYSGTKRWVQRIDSRKPSFIADLVRSEIADGRQVLVWTVFDEESALLADLLKGINIAVLTGATKPAERLRLIEEFRHGRLDGLVSKAALLGFGLNFPNCSSMVFSGWDDSYERFYQAVKRAVRYGQTKSVRVHIPYIEELEGMILDNVLRKKDSFERDAEMQERFYLAALREVLPAA